MWPAHLQHPPHLGVSESAMHGVGAHANLPNANQHCRRTTS
jgi:hypothetical protein